jgi:CspA family cold shock protein
MIREATNTGVVKFYLESKAFGFITDDAEKKDIFVHGTNTLDRIVAGDLVAYDVETGQRGLKCVNVRRIKTDGLKEPKNGTGESK